MSLSFSFVLLTVNCTGNDLPLSINLVFLACVPCVVGLYIICICYDRVAESRYPLGVPWIQHLFFFFQTTAPSK
jgi:hypothetical protein